MHLNYLNAFKLNALKYAFFFSGNKDLIDPIMTYATELVYLRIYCNIYITLLSIHIIIFGYDQL